MRQPTAAVIALILAAAPALAQDQSGPIRAVIQDQIADFQANDLPGAFAHASPAIQDIFGTPDNFGRMVQSGYPMVWRPAVVEMRGLTQTPKGWVQTVVFQGQDGHLAEADYLMQLIDGQWRIAGVTLRALPGVGS